MDTELIKKLLKYVDADPVDITVSGGNFTTIPNIPSGHVYLFATVVNWYNSSNPFSVHGSNRTFYVNAPAGTFVKDLRVRYWYMSA